MEVSVDIGTYRFPGGVLAVKCYRLRRVILVLGYNKRAVSSARWFYVIAFLVIIFAKERFEINKG